MAEFSVKQKKTKEGVQLIVSGDLTIEHAAEMRQTLLDAFDKGSPVIVDLSAVEAIDVSGLQLFCAAHRTSLGHEKRLVVKGALQPAVQRSAECAGYFRHVGCSQDVTKTCVWVGGE